MASRFNANQLGWKANPSFPEPRNWTPKPLTILAGDSNIYSVTGDGLDIAWNEAAGSSVDATWEATVHVRKGQICLADGSVQQTTTPQLQELISTALTSSGGSTNVIFSKPRGVQ